MDVLMAMENLAPNNCENAVPSKAKAAKVPKASKGGANNVLKPSNGQQQSQKDGRRVEDIYQKKSQLEHILLRPDTYVGSIEQQTTQTWVNEGDGVAFKTITYVPALFKLFDEIMVNAIDNKVRDATMSTLKVEIDRANGVISVMNDGAGIPVEMHSEEKVYVPELIFGHLLTSSNYDDTEKKVTGGRNGYGAKLANVFSTEFTVETCDGHRQKRYKQVFSNNMSKIGKPVIKDCKATENWTKISFKPDFVKFGMEELEEDICSLMRKRVYDAAGVLGKGAKVFLDNTRLPIKDFSNYVDLFLRGKENPVKIHEKVNDRWEICISMSEGQFSQVSFVNGICTLRGGTHVNHIADQVASKLMLVMNKKNKGANVKAFQIKNHLMVFVNALIENPAFDSQTKETLTLKASSFGSKCEISDAIIKKVINSPINEAILSWASFKQSKDLKKNDGSKRTRLTGIPKLDDANDAGTKNSQDCTLILTEGDSAKALAISGLSVVGRDRYGVFPLRGKLLNVRDATHEQIMNNVEINAIKQILGLQHGKTYTDVKALRYGHLMIMTDQDHDGSHIKGLLINFLHHFFPSLLKVPGFLVEFITPIIKVAKGRTTIPFYTMPEYEAWKETLPDGNTKGWSIKYYKGLGTSTAAEAKEYFAELAFHRKNFLWECDGDGGLIEMAFSKKKVEDRKQWLRSFVPGTFLDHTVEEVKYSDFINRELILFSRADLQRSIPSLLDGLKPGQRKIMFSVFKRKLRNDIKVAQLAGYVSEHSAYHHGEASLMSTIVGLAQNYCGSNNINLLVPSGQFGTRLLGGKDHASPRYIFTRLQQITRILFPECDDQLLDFNLEDGQVIEPEVYLPIIPLVLVNGADGIGTGWSTNVPNFNPRDVVENLRCMLADTPTVPMHPWFSGFKGGIELQPDKTSGASKGTSYLVTGNIEQVDETTLRITELPIRKWTQDYKEFLEQMIKPDKKDQAPFIQDYKEYHTDTSVHFEVKLSEACMREALNEGLLKKFKLSTTMGMSNMHLFNSQSTIAKYESVEQIMSEFFAVRLDAYERRRAALIKQAEAEMSRLDNKMRFILGVIKGEIKINNRKKKDIEADLETMGFDKMTKASKAVNGKGGTNPVEADGEDADGETAEGASASAAKLSYDYLLSMPLYSLTLEKVQSLCADRDAKEAEVAVLRATDAKKLWEGDLDTFLVALDEMEAEQDALNTHANKQKAKAKSSSNGRGKKAAAKGKKKLTSDSEDDDDFSDEEFAPKKKAPIKRAPASKPAPVAKAAAAKQPAAPQPSVASFFAAAGGTDDVKPKPAAAAKAPPKAKAAAPLPAAPPVMMKVEDSDSDDEPLSLMERLARRTSPAAIKPVAAPLAAKKVAPAAKKAPAARKKAAVVVFSESDSSDFAPEAEEQQAMVREPAAQPARRAVAARPVVVDDESDAEASNFGDDGSDDEIDMEMSPKMKKKGGGKGNPAAAATIRPVVATKKPAARKGKAQKAKVDSDDEAKEDMFTPLAMKKTASRMPSSPMVDEASDDDFEFDGTPSPKPKAKGRAPAAKKATTKSTAVNKRTLKGSPGGKVAPVVVVLDDSASEGPTPNPKKTKRATPPSPAAAPPAGGGRPARAARGGAVSYVVEDSDEEEEEEQSEEEASEEEYNSDA